MSSGFVSGGTTEQPARRNQLWVRAEEELEAARAQAREQKAHEGKSLYEVLQANKAAKQEAFEESTKLKNQFRSLDEDDVDFLNSISDKDRAKQETVQKETSDQLEAFRRQQQRQENLETTKLLGTRKGNDTSSVDNETTQWQNATKKRKRARDGKTLRGIKIIKGTTSDYKLSKDGRSPAPQSEDDGEARDTPPAFIDNEKELINSASTPTISLLNVSDGASKQGTAARASSLCLVGYSSDEQ